MAFVLGDDLVGPGVTTSNALAAIEGVLPLIEIVDSRIVDWRIHLADTVADNASSGRLVVGLPGCGPSVRRPSLGRQPVGQGVGREVGFVSDHSSPVMALISD